MTGDLCVINAVKKEQMLRIQDCCSVPPARTRGNHGGNASSIDIMGNFYLYLRPVVEETRRR